MDPFIPSVSFQSGEFAQEIDLLAHIAVETLLVTHGRLGIHSPQVLVSQANLLDHLVSVHRLECRHITRKAIHLVLNLGPVDLECLGCRIATNNMTLKETERFPHLLKRIFGDHADHLEWKGSDRVPGAPRLERNELFERDDKLDNGSWIELDGIKTRQVTHSQSIARTVERGGYLDTL
jgi:hypothetical protein